MKFGSTGEERPAQLFSNQDMLSRVLFDEDGVSAPVQTTSAFAGVDV